MGLPGPLGPQAACRSCLATVSWSEDRPGSLVTRPIGGNAGLACVSKNFGLSHYPVFLENESMKKVGTLVLFAVAIMAIVSWKVAPVQAYPPFFEEFKKKYTKETPTTPEETAFKETVTTTKCGICHTGKTKKVRNTYGLAIEKFIPEVVGKPTPTKTTRTHSRRTP